MGSAPGLVVRVGLTRIAGPTRSKKPSLLHRSLRRKGAAVEFLPCPRTMPKTRGSATRTPGWRHSAEVNAALRMKAGETPLRLLLEGLTFTRRAHVRPQSALDRGMIAHLDTGNLLGQANSLVLSWSRRRPDPCGDRARRQPSPSRSPGMKCAIRLPQLPLRGVVRAKALRDRGPDRGRGASCLPMCDENHHHSGQDAGNAQHLDLGEP